MNDENQSHAVRSNTKGGKRGRSVGRRTVIKGGVVAVAGLTLGTTYVKPNVISVGVQEVFAASSPPLADPPPPSQGCTPGYWGNSPGGRGLWDAPNDPDWSAAGGAGENPFNHGTLFNSFFTPVHPQLDGLTMIDLAGSGGTSGEERKAARDLIAAYLNASFGMSYRYSTAGLISMWNEAVSTGGFAQLHDILDAANNSSCPLPGRW